VFKRNLQIVSLAFVVCAAAHAQGAAPEGAEWHSLFNGKDLSGWTMKIAKHPLGENYRDTFRVEDNMIKVAYDKYEGPFRGRYGHLFYKEPFSNYLVRIEYRFVGDQANGGPGWATSTA